MRDRHRIARLLPHAGAMVLLDEIEDWDADGIRCRSGTHLRLDNPLRRNGRLPAIAGVEYGMQAAAAHGALTATDSRPVAGVLAGLRAIVLSQERLDDAALGCLHITATVEHAEAQAVIYGFLVAGDDGRLVVSGRGTVARIGTT